MRVEMVAIGVVLAALGARADEPKGGPQATPPASIEGTLWRLSAIRGESAAALAALPRAPELRFEAGRVQGSSGCNQLAGSYTLEGDRVVLGPLAGTMMACAAPVMAVETALKRELAGALRFRVAEGRLALSAASDAADAAPRLVFEAAPPPRLAGTAWEVTGFNNGRSAVVSPLVGTALTLSFRDGQIAGHAGCNGFRATYSVDGDRLEVGPVATTKKLCDAKGIMQQEREFLAALASATTWALDRGMLDLHRADGERVLHANPAQ
ncbi:MAG TPA: META domain-containing protein [Myxococcota bacterium]|nr:META domain-containing protein [Myxococcota bacterium]